MRLITMEVDGVLLLSFANSKSNSTDYLKLAGVPHMSSTAKVGVDTRYCHKSHLVTTVAIIMPVVMILVMIVMVVLLSYHIIYMDANFLQIQTFPV